MKVLIVILSVLGVVTVAAAVCALVLFIIISKPGDATVAFRNASGEEIVELNCALENIEDLRIRIYGLPNNAKVSAQFPVERTTRFVVTARLASGRTVGPETNGYVTRNLTSSIEFIVGPNELSAK